MTTHTHTHIGYAEAAARYGTSIRRLERLATAGHLTRYKSHRDARITLFSTAELDKALNSVHPAA